MTLDKLEADLNNTHDEAIERTAPAELIYALPEVLFAVDKIRATSVITHRNHTGIIRAMALNEYIETRYGKENRLTILDALIHEKVTWINSIGGTGQNKLIEGLNALKLEIKAQGGLDLSDRLFGMK